MSSWPALFLLALIAVNVCAGGLHEPTIIESWENSVIHNQAGSAAGWYISERIHSNIVVTPSSEHVTSGKKSLRIDSDGGWSQVLMYQENTEDGKPAGVPLREQLINRLTLNLDVFTGENLDWSKVEIAMQGNALPWTQLNTNALLPGPTNIKYLIPLKVGAAIEKCDRWFQFFIIINTSSKGTIYIDSLGVE
jgi:hypothetical protein